MNDIATPASHGRGFADPDLELGKLIGCVRGPSLTNAAFRWHHIALLVDEIERLRNKVDELRRAHEPSGMRAAMEAIRDMTNADSPESYRADDREGCLDAVFARASRALESNAGETRDGCTCVARMVLHEKACALMAGHPMNSGAPDVPSVFDQPPQTRERPQQEVLGEPTGSVDALCPRCKDVLSRKDRGAE